jgi:outer membrane biosynthesis protein TonB
MPLWLHCIGLSFFPFSFEKKLKEREDREELTNFLTLKNAQMKTAEKNNAKGVQGATAKGNEVRTENRPSLTGKEAKQDETATNQKPAEAPKSEEAKAAEVTPGNPATVDNHIPNAEQQPQQQEVKAEASQAEPKPQLSLEAKIKAVNELHRKTIQRLALLTRIKTLEEFEVQLEEENDELEGNPYQGCKLIIEDDKRRQFVTNTPGLIRMVSQFIFDACNDKLAEIERNINFPQA